MFLFPVLFQKIAGGRYTSRNDLSNAESARSFPQEYAFRRRGEAGSFDELLRQGGVFAGMAARQGILAK